MPRVRWPRYLGRRQCALVLAAAALAALGAGPPAGEPIRIRWLGEMRHVELLAPLTAAGEAPLLLVLGEADRSARYYLDGWREVAEREGLLVAAVEPQNHGRWRVPMDGPGLLRAVVREVSSRRRVDPRRVYLFGAGSGGGFALIMGTLQPRYFAAVASFGGDVPAAALRDTERLERPLPVGIYYSKRTPQFSVEALEQSAEALRRAGAVVGTEQLSAGPDFERSGRKVAVRIWAALSAHELTEGPRYLPTPYDR